MAVLTNATKQEPIVGSASTKQEMDVTLNVFVKWNQGKVRRSTNAIFGIVVCMCVYISLLLM